MAGCKPAPSNCDDGEWQVKQLTRFTHVAERLDLLRAVDQNLERQILHASIPTMALDVGILIQLLLEGLVANAHFAVLVNPLVDNGIRQPLDVVALVVRSCLTTSSLILEGNTLLPASLSGSL
jgi:hypothetical protein